MDAIFKIHYCTHYLCWLNRFWMTYRASLFINENFLFFHLSNAFYSAEHMKPKQVKYICMKIAASFINPVCFREKKSNIKTNLWIQARRKKTPNFLPQFSLVHCPSESWTDYGSSPPIALFWPLSLEEKEYAPGKWQFHKNVGSLPEFESPNLHRYWAHSLCNTTSNLGH